LNANGHGSQNVTGAPYRTSVIRSCAPRAPGTRSHTSDDERFLGRAGEIQSRRVGEPRAEPVRRRPRVDEAGLDSLFEVLDLHRHDRSR
jgi:hypothetical protein